MHDHRSLLRRFTGLGIARCLIGSGTEMPVAQSSPSAFEQDHTFVMRFDLADELACLAVINDRTARYLDDLVFAILTERTALSALASIGRHDMLLVLEMEQGPEVTVTA